MSAILEIEARIYEMRQALYEVIDRKNNLLDSEVITASKKLDELLNEYNKLTREEIK
ncbi:MULTISPECIES: aspartyl-phosphate phosphatase Spo0E family protein [unclassified Clostridium]|uniref:aspartyl-phosphate phosphatase Spo0E family protein n=1 Tax=unclassified Clostridium TaxID=2614128 RepID=UPI00023AFE0E|nr:MULTISPECIES: aspartyl-phosphate phosphatase Spo0E family protein [unclassified Clostridium]EHI99640.1 Sporulation stage 0, Spo0E-like regulatory phosphatase [Clostridium sp. DL-VIII]OOM80124.1 Spo0E like sporulation regulatory protein [Clostridium sp. BL-8]